MSNYKSNHRLEQVLDILVKMVAEESTTKRSVLCSGGIRLLLDEMETDGRCRREDLDVPILMTTARKEL